MTAFAVSGTAARIAAITIGFAFGLTGLVTNCPAQVITEFAAGISPGGVLVGIAAGPDGNVWFTKGSADQVGKISPTGVVTEYSSGITPPAGPLAIAPGPDGNVWFTANKNPHRVAKITPAGAVTEYSAGITPGADPEGIVTGPDGNLWFTEYNLNRIGTITPTGTVTEFGAGISANALPYRITSGPDGNLWFTEFNGGRIGRITPAGVVTEFSAGISPGAFPRAITLGPDGNLWFTESIGKIGRITPAGVVTEFTVPGAGPGIAGGPDGNLWFTERGFDRIGRITPTGIVTEYSTGITPGSQPTEITLGPDGNLWFIEAVGRRIARLVPPPNELVVTNTNDSGPGSLRGAIAQANADPWSNLITFDPSVTGTITLTSGNLQITSGPLTIAGPGAGVLAIDGNGSSRIFTVYEPGVPGCPALTAPNDFLVSISGLTLQNGRQNTDNSGGAILSAHSLALDSVVIQNNAAPRGGGVSFSAQYAGQALTVTNSQFLGNVAKPTNAGTASADTGGGLLIADNCGGTHTVTATTIANSLFSGNSSQPTTLGGYGGAIGAFTPGTVAITDTRIVNNSVVAPNPPVPGQAYRGGGLYVSIAKALSVVRSEISGNSTIDGTNAGVTRGGGIGAINNLSTLQGAADVMNFSIVDSTISGNTDTAFGGAMWVYGNVAVDVDNSTISGNTSAPANSGGIRLTTGATSPSTGTNATAPTLAMVSSIVAGNSADDIATNLATMPTFTLNMANSLVGSLCPSPTCVISVAGTGNLFNTDPLLGPLANNGGPTQTHALLAGSPAINAGSNPLGLTTDQRGPGFPRILGGTADMGAYESTPVAPSPILQNAKSRKSHGTAGTFDLALSLITTSPATESRAGPTQTIVMTFDKPIASADNPTTTEGTATFGSMSFSGNDVIMNFTGVTNPQYVTFNLANVAATDGGIGGTGSVRVGFLFGDVNQSRQVTVADVGIVNSVLLQTVTGANFLRDVNVDGKLTVADKGLTNANLLQKLPAP